MATNGAKVTQKGAKGKKSLPFWCPFGTQAALVHQGHAFVHHGLGGQMHGAPFQARKD